MITTVAFDLGGVLIDWNPRYLYRKLLSDEADVDRFLSTVCTPAWNHEQDAGRSWADGIFELVERFPQYESLIRAYWERWEEMLGDSIDSTVEILDFLRERGTHLLALTNWSAETFPFARRKYPFLEWFDGIVVSGEEGVAKPDPSIYTLMLNRHNLEASEVAFIDDQPRNIEAALRLGMVGHVYSKKEELEAFLSEVGLIR